MLKPALIFQDHMVLQRDKIVLFWGTAGADETVSVSVQGRTYTGRSDVDGRWRIEVGPLHPSFCETVTIMSLKERIECKDVQVGDVWLAGGQSNMEFYMRYDADYETEKLICHNDAIRFFDYPKVFYPEQIHEADYGENFGFWRKAAPEDLEWFSATAYYFAKELQKKREVPIGILGCNWGGTPACAWMDERSIREGGGHLYLEEYQSAVKELDLASYDEKFKQNPASWKLNPFQDPVSDMLMRGMDILDVIRSLTGQEPDLSEMDVSAMMPVMGPKNETRPGGLYESMLCQVAPYGIRGILFYQGESDGDRHPELYATLFPALIRCFRDLWQEELPFLFVQIAPLKRWMQCEGKPYATIREAQQLTVDTVPNTGMAVISDVGMEFDIHPKKKQPVGHRLALLAENKVYGEDILCEAPTLVMLEAEDGKLTLKFANSGEGLHLAEHTPDGVQTNPHKLECLRIFQKGQVLDMEEVRAEAVGDTVTLLGNEFQKGGTITVELGCCGWYRVNLYNSAGIPARPARMIIE